MKNLKYLLAIFTVVILASSCATMGGAGSSVDLDDPRVQQFGNRVYVDDPYYGTIVLQRDPYTGRYFDITPGGRFGAGAGYYGRVPYGGHYRTAPVVRQGTNRNFGGNGNVIKPQTPNRQPIQQGREATRSRILGNQR